MQNGDWLGFAKKKVALNNFFHKSQEPSKIVITFYWPSYKQKMLTYRMGNQR